MISWVHLSVESNVQLNNLLTVDPLTHTKGHTYVLHYYK
jgi:hypothetical protein